MRSLWALALLVFVVLGCNFGSKSNSNNSSNSNNTINVNKVVTMKDRFVGTWQVSTESDFDGGPITFKSDNTYSAQKSMENNSGMRTGTYEVRGDRLYCKGDLENETPDGFKMEDERISLKMKGKTIYFDKKK